MLDLGPIKKRCAEATPGKWEWKAMDSGEFIGMVSPQTVILCAKVDDFHTQRKDAEYMACSRTDLPACVAEIERLRAELSGTSMRLHTTETAAYIMRLALKKACRRIPGRRFGKRYFIMKAMKQVANSNDIGEDEDS